MTESPGKLGLGTIDQAEPFQDSYKGCWGLVPRQELPTAMHELADTQDTPWRPLP